MRRIFPSREVYHLWANERQSEARNAGDTVSFHGMSAYSYAAEIGRIVKREGGRKAFFVNTHSYSVTTSKHQSYLRRAIPSIFPVFRVPSMDFIGNHDAMLEHYAAQTAELEGKIKRARTHKDTHLHYMQMVQEELEAYCRFYDLASMGAFAPDAEKYRELMEAAQARLKQAREERAERERIERADDARRWRAGEFVPNIYYHPDTMLRIIGEQGGPAVQTSRGATVPLVAARRMVALWRAGRELAGKRIGGYIVRRFDGNVLEVGCHRIDVGEMARFAELVEVAHAG